MEIFKNLGIQWPYFLSQLVNFFILLFLLKRFLYAPLIEILRKRRDLIEKGIADAQSVEIEKNRFEEVKKEDMKIAKAEARAMIERAINAGEKMKAGIIKEAEERGRDLIRYAEARAEEEKRQLTEDVKREMGAVIDLLTEKVLREKVDEQKDSDYTRRSLTGIK
ncbi:MAG: F0F1 ATP synthase subunit B [Patescibacteria group bacterium]|mgnify:CR=1 FL=1